MSYVQLAHERMERAVTYCRKPTARTLHRLHDLLLTLFFLIDVLVQLLGRLQSRELFLFAQLTFVQPRGHVANASAPWAAGWDRGADV